ncbi:hypothetical protein [Kitasatospora viridis]|uniref:Parallel beta helix pectate lyase-like protein n=1 Tax=Kitasatospora viridis TaxID=281105 RepID=A0A561S995_9ACTN|nr:hypothetical protein [Kitasatospora viridis]TWF71440.1 hypothetical protein FHX73_1970 [Kitasatospora viridis]
MRPIPPQTLRLRLLASAGAVTLAAGFTAFTFGAANAASPAAPVTLYASPTGSGSKCSASEPCSLGGAQSAVRGLNPGRKGGDVTVDLLDGTYRPTSTWAFSAADSGSPGHPVVWQAAPGAHPVISGASQVTGWTQVGTSGVWSAPVPAGSASRQLYVNGHEAPIAQASRTELGFNAAGRWGGSSTGYDISNDSTATAWFAALTPAQVAGVEFTYPGGNGQWTEPRCRVASYADGKLTMAQPCWADTTARSGFSQGSGGLPSMPPNSRPTLIENARTLLHPGQWFLDSAANTLYYQPSAGQQMSGLDVELPHLESLVQGAGTLAAPLHDLTLKGLQFSYATWNAPSAPSGFAEVQSNLRFTGATNQNMCTHSHPAGSCPWGSLTQPLANVAFTAAKNVTLTGNRFAELGGAGLSLMYGAADTQVRGNEFTDIASTGLLLGCTSDPNPTNPNPTTDPDTPDVIKQGCTPDASAVSGDTIGTNEILTGTAVSDNVIHHVGTDYPAAPGITLLFSQGTTITHNDLYDLPYTGITAGVIQGHVDQARTPQNSVNINQDNTISDNLIHDYLSVRSDGGAVYVEGHQAQYYDANGKPVGYKAADPTRTLAHGLQVTGNVAYNGGNANFTYYDDAGSEWINWQGNVAFSAGRYATGGCSPTGHIWVTGNYTSAAVNVQSCNGPTDMHVSGNTKIPGHPGPDDLSALPAALLNGAGVRAANHPLPAAGAQSFYTSEVSATDQVLVAGEGFTANTQVYEGDTPVSSSDIHVLSSGLLVATVRPGTQSSQIWVGNRIDDTDPAIAYNGFKDGSHRGYGDLGDDVHWATKDGSTASYTFTGGFVQVYGEQSTDQGTLGVTIDNGTQQTVNTVPADGQRHTNVPVYTASGLDSGTHTITVTKLSGQYATLDGFGTGATAPSWTRLDDTDEAIAYDGFTTSAHRGYGDLGDDVHAATEDGSTATYHFTGSYLQVFGEQSTDQGTLGISIDNGTQQIVNTVPADGQRHSNVPVYTVSGLGPDSHTVVVTKLSGTYATLDGFGAL